jgi:hypothetical protein
MEANPYRRFYLITHPRSASNLLVRILALEEQPNVGQGTNGSPGYFFMSSFQLIKDLDVRGKHVRDWTEDERRQIKQAYQDDFNKLEAYVEASRAQAKIAFVKEHSYFMIEPVAQTRSIYGGDSVEESPWTVQIPSTYGSEVTHSRLNETVLPDEFLMTWLPTFLIRHPALSFPSLYRAFTDIVFPDKDQRKDEQMEVVMTFRWTRTLYEWYAQQLSKSSLESGSGSDITWPLVLEADDVINQPEVVIKFSELVGLDPTKLKFSWDPATEEEVAKLPGKTHAARMLSTLLASNGVLKSKTSANIDVDTEAKKWRDEFGDGEGKRMEKWVRAAMPDYEFLKAKRLRPNAA